MYKMGLVQLIKRCWRVLGNLEKNLSVIEKVVTRELLRYRQ